MSPDEHLQPRNVVGPILVVDDDEAMLRATCIGLRARGFRVEVARTGPEGRELALTGRHSAILLDLGLPGLDGTEVIRQVRGSISAPIVVVSARDSAQDKDAAFASGANEYVVKPFALSHLIDGLIAALGSREDGRSPSRQRQGHDEVHSLAGVCGEI